MVPVIPVPLAALRPLAHQALKKIRAVTALEFSAPLRYGKIQKLLEYFSASARLRRDFASLACRLSVLRASSAG